MAHIADIQNLRFEVQASRFLADVLLNHKGTLYRYAVEVAAPVSIGFEKLRPALLSAAETLHGASSTRADTVQLHSELLDRGDDIASRVLSSGPQYLDRILSRKSQHNPQEHARLL